MKITILVIAMVLLLSFPIHANKTKFGIKTEVTLNGQTRDPESSSLNNTIMLALGLGGFAEIPINRTLSIQPELLLSMKETQWRLDSGNFAIMSYTYLDIPVILKLKINSFINLQTGMIVAILLQARAQETVSGVEQTSYDFKTAVENLNLSLVVGAGLSLGKFDLGIRYAFGITDTNKASTVTDLKWSRLVLSVEFAF